jgi:hypothetical protein
MSAYDDPEEDGPEERFRRPTVDYARNRVRAPAVVMLSFAILSLVGVPLGVINFFTLPAVFKAQRDQIDQDPNMPAAQKRQVTQLLDVYERVILAVLPFTLTLQFVVGIASVVGSLKMLKLSSRGWALAAAILNVVSFGHGCCFLTLPVGIWAMVVLMDERVKAGFASARRAAGHGDREHDRYQH